MKRILIIGNNNGGNSVTDGGRIKIRLFFSLLSKEGHILEIADLYKWKLHVVRLISAIKKAIKNKDIILIMAGPNGCRPIIKLVNHLNKKRYSRVVFCPLGIGSLDILLKDKNPDEVRKFMSCKDFLNISDDSFKKELQLLDKIILQNDVICKTYRQFYNLSNVCVLQNFRDAIISCKNTDCSSPILKIVYMARITNNKGIFDLIDVVKRINKNTDFQISLDIFGDNQLNKEESSLFFSLLDKSISYLGELFDSDAIALLKKYDLFCLPTKYHGEGTSGSFIEAMIAGTPVLLSSYSQADSLIKDGKTGFIFEIGNTDSLYEKLIYISKNKEMLRVVSKNAQIDAVKYTYESNKSNFLNYIIGD